MPNSVVTVVGDEELATALADRVRATVRSVPTPEAAGDRGDPEAVGCAVVDCRGVEDPTDRVRAVAGALPGVPVVAVTDGDAVPVEAVLDAGAVDVYHSATGRVPGEVLARRVEPVLARDVVARDTMAALHEVTPELFRAANEGRVVELAVDAADEMLGFPGAAVRLADEEEGVLRGVGMGGEATVDHDPLEPFSIADSPHGRAYRTGKTVTKRSDAGDPDPFDRTVYVPIEGHGVLSAGRTDPGRFDPVRLRALETLAANVAAALDRVQRENDLRDQRAELRRRNERLDEFASLVSHDLRNPLNVAQGYVQHAASTGDLDVLSKADEALERMDRLVDDALALARGEELGDTEPVSLVEVVRAAWESQVNHGEEATLVVGVDPDRELIADPDALGRLVANLLENAVDHAGDDATVRVTTLGDQRTSGFAVGDDGPGIPEDERETVFERGFTTSDEGTGLGLSIVAEVAEAHDWVVRAEESEAGGARIEVRDVDWVSTGTEGADEAAGL